MVATELKRADEGQRKSWDEEGYVLLENAITGDPLSRLQEAFERCSHESKPEWLEAVSEGRRSSSFFDIPDPLERDDAFVDMIDHGGTLGLLRDFLGEDMTFRGLGARTVPPCPISYVGWHPDVHRDRTPLHIKVQIYVNDVGEDRGPFAYVPRSHLEGAGPYPRVKHLDAMPGHRTLPGKAGTAVMFNCYGWHTSMINRTLEPRKSLIIGYGVFDESEYAVDKKRKNDRYGALRERLSPKRKYLFGFDR